jgi:hypothetical protein
MGSSTASNQRGAQTSDAVSLLMRANDVLLFVIRFSSRVRTWCIFYFKETDLARMQQNLLVSES